MNSALVRLEAVTPPGPTVAGSPVLGAGGGVRTAAAPAGRFASGTVIG
jgi:hypothetical protein